MGWILRSCSSIPHIQVSPYSRLHEHINIHTPKICIQRPSGTQQRGGMEWRSETSNRKGKLTKERASCTGGSAASLKQDSFWFSLVNPSHFGNFRWVKHSIINLLVLLLILVILVSNISIITHIIKAQSPHTHTQMQLHEKGVCYFQVGVWIESLQWGKEI